MTLPLKDIYTSRNGNPLSSRPTSAEPTRPFECGDYLEGRSKALLNETHPATTDGHMLVPPLQFLSAGTSEEQSQRFGWGPSGQHQKKCDAKAAECRRMQSFLPGKRVLQGVHTAKSVQLAAIRANGRRSGDSRVQGRPGIGGVNGVGVCDFLNRTYTPQKLSISQLTAAEMDSRHEKSRQLRGLGHKDSHLSLQNPAIARSAKHEGPTVTSDRSPSSSGPAILLTQRCC